MGADNTISYMTGSLAAMGVLAFFVAVIVQTVKELPVLKKLPTSAVALGVSLILCPLSLLAFCACRRKRYLVFYLRFRSGCISCLSCGNRRLGETA